MQEYIKKILGFDNDITTLITSNDEMGDIKIFKSFEDSGLLLKRVSETIQKKAKEQKWGFLSMLLGTLGASFLWNIWAGKGAIAKRQGQGVITAGDGAIAKRQGRRFIRAGYGSTIKNKDF